QGDPLRLAPQLVPGAFGRGFLEGSDEQREGAFVDRPGVVGQWVGHRHVVPKSRGRNIGNSGRRAPGATVIARAERGGTPLAKQGKAVRSEERRVGKEGR